jgi:hypothetical protein
MKQFSALIFVLILVACETVPPIPEECQMEFTHGGVADVREMARNIGNPDEDDTCRSFEDGEWSEPYDCEIVIAIPEDCAALSN